MNFQGARLAILGCLLGTSGNPTLKASTEQLRLSQHVAGWPHRMPASLQQQPNHTFCAELAWALAKALTNTGNRCLGLHGAKAT